MDLRDWEKEKLEEETAAEKTARIRSEIKGRMDSFADLLHEDSLSGTLALLVSLFDTTGDAAALHQALNAVVAAIPDVGRSAAGMRPGLGVNPDDLETGGRMGWASAIALLAELRGWALPGNVLSELISGRRDSREVFSALYQSESFDEAAVAFASL